MKGARVLAGGEAIGTPRCLQPVEFYEITRDRDVYDIIWPRTEASSVCWRPKGHDGPRHVAKPSYLRGLEYRRRRGHPERQRRKAS